MTHKWFLKEGVWIPPELALTNPSAMFHLCRMLDTAARTAPEVVDGRICCTAIGRAVDPNKFSYHGIGRAVDIRTGLSLGDDGRPEWRQRIGGIDSTGIVVVGEDIYEHAVIWSQRIRDALKGEAPPILEPKLDRVKCACYEMALGTEVFITSTDGTKTIHPPGTQVRIPPGQFALLLTEEELRLPLNILAFISIKASKKIGGLVNVSGFHVDPGFCGRLKFSVYNAGVESIVLDVGERLFPIWFYELPESNEDDYVGTHKGQMTIASDDVMRMQGDVASPAALKKEIDELRSTVANWKAATTGALVTAIATAIAAVLAAVVNAGQ